jgi:hypothetical protein
MAHVARGPSVEAQDMPFLMLALEQRATEPGPSPIRIPGLDKEHRFDTLLYRVVSKLL